jgi:transcriptional regulator with XRE-family HTH domain
VPSLADVRAAVGLSQTALAARSGVSLATIQRIERGRTRPSPRVVTRLSHALGEPPEAITEFRAMAYRTHLPQPAVRPAVRHILILDGSPAVLQALRDLLDGQGYRVSTGSCTELDPTAIATLAPDLILLGDVEVNDGLCWSQLREDPGTAAIPLVLSTSSSSAGSDADEVERQVTEPGLWVVTRPFDLAVLLATIREALHPPEQMTSR